MIGLSKPFPLFLFLSFMTANPSLRFLMFPYLFETLSPNCFCLSFFSSLSVCQKREREGRGDFVYERMGNEGLSVNKRIFLTRGGSRKII